MGPYDRGVVPFQFTEDTLGWLRQQVEPQQGYVADLDKGFDEGEAGYLQNQVYLLHVLRSIEAQSVAEVVS